MAENQADPKGEHKPKTDAAASGDAQSVARAAGGDAKESSPGGPVPELGHSLACKLIMVGAGEFQAKGRVAKVRDDGALLIGFDQLLPEGGHEAELLSTRYWVLERVYEVKPGRTQIAKERDRMLLHPPFQVTEVEHRKAYRVDVVLDVLWKKCGEKTRGKALTELMADKSTPAKKARTWNLSGSGLSMVVGEPLKEGDTAALTVSLTGESLTAAGRVLWVKPDPQGKGRTLIGIEFLDLPAVDEAKIVRTVIRSSGLLTK